MKHFTIGILGGAGPMAGAFLFERIIGLCQTVYHCSKDADFPKIILLSFPFSEMLEGVIDRELVKKELYLGLEELGRNGADICVIACNTLHAFLDEVPENLIHLPQILKEEAQSEEGILVLCTSTSARSAIHKQYIDCRYLDPKSQQDLDQIIDLLLKGKDVLDSLLRLIHKQKEKMIVLGCTELSLLKSRLAVPNKQIIDPLDIAAKKIIQKMEDRYVSTSIRIAKDLV